MPAPRPIIAHVLHRLDRAGAEVLAAGLARDLTDRFDSVFFCLDGLGPLAQELAGAGFVVESFDRRPGIDRGLARRMRKQIDELGVSLLHCHQYTPFFYGSLARGLTPGRRRALPLIFTEHGRHYPDHRSTKRVLANKVLMGRRDAVTAVGGFVKQALIDNEGLPAARIEVIHNGIEPGETIDSSARSSALSGARSEARAALGIADNAPVVMQVARFHSVKDHPTAIAAFAKVNAQMPDATLVFIGDGPGRADAEQQARRLGLTDRIMFTGVRDDVRRLLPGADVFLLSSLSEGVSVTLLEAMDAGLAIVATEVGGNGEVVEHEKTGLLAPRGDAAALAGHLLTLLNDPALANGFGHAGRNRLLERFTQAQMHGRYNDIYRRLVNDALG